MFSIERRNTNLELGKRGHQENDATTITIGAIIIQSKYKRTYIKE
jgi:hypothetical protein